jgi:hypothetical protein
VVIWVFSVCGETHASTFPDNGNRSGDAPPPLNYGSETSTGRDVAVIHVTAWRQLLCA